VIYVIFDSDSDLIHYQKNWMTIKNNIDHYQKELDGYQKELDDYQKELDHCHYQR
jgi:peptidoglycan hydrolase CwlO-like protein